jgi:hypothetical protein
MRERRSLKSKLMRVVRKSYHLNTVCREFEYHLDPLYKKHPLIIYQMGKVGSETIERSLLACNLGRPICRAHALVPEHLQNGLRAVGMSQREYFKRSTHAFRAKYLARELSRDLYRGHWQVITMVRDPVAQNISSFFQTIDMHVSDFEERAKTGRISTQELMDIFLARFPVDGIYNKWFDVEMRKSLDIDVYASRFQPETGYKVYHEPHVDLLLLRLEDLDRCAAEAFNEFLRIPDFKILRKNESERKSYHRLYKEFREHGVFPKVYVDAVYGSKYARHFYSDAELTQFKSRLRIAD